ncbi:MAG TPA: hypothetical protein VJP02_09360 [Candidatus Sulfotelmatobacter sp.]|nr:hypothetical protein [Candidatus Sulfotelmatobacter sp.]
MSVLRIRFGSASRPSRHLLWTLALVERLLRRILAASSYRENMTLLRTARSWISGPRKLLLPDSRRLHSPISTPERTILLLGESTRWLSDKRPFPGSRSTFDGDAARRTGSLQSRWNTTLQTTPLSTIAIGKRALEAPQIHQLRARIEHPQAFPLQLVGAGRIPRLPLNETAELTAGESIARRLPRQYRRVEDCSFARGLNSSEKSTPSLVSGPSVVVDRPRPRVQRDSAGGLGSAGERKDPIAQPQLNTNVTQITDAVLKQLDRRLVAARERMGRI